MHANVMYANTKLCTSVRDSRNKINSRNTLSHESQILCYVSMCVCVCVYIHTHTYTYKHTYKNMGVPIVAQR